MFFGQGFTKQDIIKHLDDVRENVERLPEVNGRWKILVRQLQTFADADETGLSESRKNMVRTASKPESCRHAKIHDEPYNRIKSCEGQKINCQHPEAPAGHISSQRQCRTGCKLFEPENGSSQNDKISG